MEVNLDTARTKTHADDIFPNWPEKKIGIKKKSPP